MEGYKLGDDEHSCHGNKIKAFLYMYSFILYFHISKCLEFPITPVYRLVREVLVFFFLITMF